MEKIIRTKVKGGMNLMFGVIIIPTKVIRNLDKGIRSEILIIFVEMIIMFINVLSSMNLYD